MRALDAPAAARRDHRLRLRALRFDLRDGGVRVVALVRQDLRAQRAREHPRRLRHVVDLPFGDLDLRRVPESIDDSMDLG
jgi:hypothetical protein